MDLGGPLYFFVGGLTGLTPALLLGVLAFGDAPELVRRGAWLTFVGSVVSPALLVSDLGRPGRFLNMLRIFKLRSAMSVGAWLLVGLGALALPTALLAQWAPWSGPDASLWARGLLFACLAGLTAVGALVGTYTGVLIGATTVPVWAVHHRTLPVHFGVAALGSAVAALSFLAGPRPALWGLGVAVATVEMGLWVVMEARRHGAADRSLRSGRTGAMIRGAMALMGPLALLLWLFGPWWLAATAFLLGALLDRYGWLAAGRRSAADPEAVLSAQRS